MQVVLPKMSASRKLQTKHNVIEPGKHDSLLSVPNRLQSLGEHPGAVTRECHPNEMHKKKKRKSSSKVTGPNKRLRSNYDWRGYEFVFSILAKNTKLTDKFHHLSSSRPLDWLV